MNKTAARLVGTIVLSLVLAACADSDQAPTTVSAEPVEDPVVTIADMAFQDGSVTVEAGTTVTWVWDDAPIEHNVVADSGAFESPLQATGEWSHTFEEPGSFAYHCSPHPQMTGTIRVVEVAEEV